MGSNSDNMSELSKSSSHQNLVPSDGDSNSLTSFPDPTPTSQSTELQNNGDPLNGLLDRSGPSMFDENHVDKAFDPQTLATAPNNVLQEIVDLHGAVRLTRRLSVLLAERDAHISALKRLAKQHNIPDQAILETESHVQRAEQRRLALSSAAQDVISRSDDPLVDSESIKGSRVIETNGGTVRGLTKMFGGAGKRRDGTKLTPASSRSTSRPPNAPERPTSVDALSVKSVNTAQSAESGSWTSTFFGNGYAASGKRQDSNTSREPVELKTQYDKAHMPPTLSDRFQDPQEVEWNRYLLKLTEARSQDGAHSNSGELIGASHFGQEGVSGQKKLRVLVQLLLGGVPMNLRQFVWMELSNTQTIVQPGAYQHFISLRESSDQTDVDAILKDVPRTLTAQYDFYTSKGYEKLKEVLVAFVAKYEDLGYTQGLNTIAGYLLLAIPSAEDAFWLLCNMMDDYFPAEYFARTASMRGPLADNKVLRQYIKELMPQLAKHMDEIGISDDHTVPLSWFFTAFSSVLPQDALMRIWDVWLCVPSNKTFIFNVALTLLKQNASGLMECETDGEYWDYLGKIKVSDDSEKIGDLIRHAFGMRKALEQVELRRAVEMNALRKKNGSTEALYSSDPDSQG